VWSAGSDSNAPGGRSGTGLRTPSKPSGAAGRPRGGGFDDQQAEAFMDLLRAGRAEPDVMPLDESVAIMRTMDAVRAQCGVRYPADGRD